MPFGQRELMHFFTLTLDLFKSNFQCLFLNFVLNVVNDRNFLHLTVHCNLHIVVADSKARLFLSLVASH